VQSVSQSVSQQYFGVVNNEAQRKAISRSRKCEYLCNVIFCLLRDRSYDDLNL